MASMDEYARQTHEQRMTRLSRTADELTAAVRGRSAAELARRPDDKNWAATEVICHLRDTDESFMARFDTIMAMDDPRFVAVDPDRWAEERQYLRNDPMQAIAAFRKRREECLTFFRGLKGDQWQRGGIHATRGRLTIDDFLSMMAWHDDNHLDQLARALEGRA